VPNELYWVDNPNGNFERLKDWEPREANKVYENNGKFLPNNNHAIRIGCDPFKYDKTKNKKRSNEVMKRAWWCGCQVLFERNVNHWKDHFAKWECDGFLMWMPGEIEPGIYTDGKGTVVQTICNYTETYINDDISKVFFVSLMKKEGGWLGFKVEDTQDSDEPMAFGFTLIAVKGKKYIRREEMQRNI
jgi:hypothetical protein